MNATLLCQHCGAPWQPTVTGACRFCHVVAPPDGASTGMAGARPTIDPGALCRLLLAMTADPTRPLDLLAGRLRQVAGDRVRLSTAGRGAPVTSVVLALDDWQYQANVDHDDVAAAAIHTVRGVVLKRQPLAFDEWVACVAGHLAEYAGTHPHVYQAIAGMTPT